MITTLQDALAHSPLGIDATNCLCQSMSCSLYFTSDRKLSISELWAKQCRYSDAQPLLLALLTFGGSAKQWQNLAPAEVYSLPPKPSLPQPKVTPEACGAMYRWTAHHCSTLNIVPVPS